MTLKYYKKPNCLEVGVDEVARGCLFGRVYAGAVIWPHEDPSDQYPGVVPPIRDSKTLSLKQRLDAKDYIEHVAVDCAVGYATEEEIDKLNILGAAQLAMHRALNKIRKRLDFDHIIVDGTYFTPFFTYTSDTVVKGDSKYYSIAAASILAKVYHDQYIEKLVEEYPALEDYDIASNVGYGTAKHLEAIKKYGVSQFHRLSFKPCQDAKQRLIKKTDKPLSVTDGEKQPELTTEQRIKQKTLQGMLDIVMLDD